MKKNVGILFLVVFGIIILYLGGCDFSSNKTEMTFDQSYNVFVGGLFNSKAFALSDIMNSKNIEDSLLLNLEGGNKDMDLDVDLDLSSYTNIGIGESKTLANFQVSRYDKVKQLPLIISGNLEILFLNHNLYANIHNFSMDSGPDNSEASLIKLIIDNYINTRILMDDPNTIDIQHIDSSNISQTYQLPNKIKTALNIYKIFDEKDVFELNGKQAYNVSLNSGVFLDFINDLGFFSDISLSGLALDAYFVVEDENNVSLIINKFVINGLEDVSGKISARNIKIKIDNKIENNSYVISLIEKRNKIQLNIDIINNLGEQTNISLDILPKLIDLGLEFIFDGSLQVSPMQFYDPIVLNLDGTYFVEKTDLVDLTEPENPLLLHQLLGDQFALPAMILEE